MGYRPKWEAILFPPAEKPECFALFGGKDKVVLKAYAKLCGKVPARAHATTGDAEMISDCLGKSDVIDSAIARFAVSYADQTEKDYSEFMKGIKSGKLSIRDEPVHEDGSI